MRVGLGGEVNQMLLRMVQRVNLRGRVVHRFDFANRSVPMPQRLTLSDVEK